MERVVPRTISALLEGERNHSLNGSSRDFVFVRDAAQACLALAEAVAVGTNPLDITFRSGWELTETEMARVIADIFAGRKPEVTDVETPTNPIGWHAAMPLTRGLAETIEWYRREYLRRSSGTHPDHLRKAA
jgi:nucleoside-diphosphate-sugar epimerase